MFEHKTFYVLQSFYMNFIQSNMSYAYINPFFYSFYNNEKYKR